MCVCVCVCVCVAQRAVSQCGARTRDHTIKSRALHRTELTTAVPQQTTAAAAIPGGIRTRNLKIRSLTPYPLGHGDGVCVCACVCAATRDRTGDLQIFSLALSQLSYSGCVRGCPPVSVA